MTALLIGWSCIVGIVEAGIQVPPLLALHTVLYIVFLLSASALVGAVLARRKPGTVVDRGTVVLDETPQETSVEPGALTLAGYPIPPVDETKHFKIIGTTGAGKSTTIRELLTGALGRGDRAVIADPDGDYLARFYDPARGDLILNPFDERSARWDLFAGITVPQDADQLARSMIPDYEGKAPTWTAAASRASKASPRYAALTATQFLKASLRTAGTPSSYAALRVSTAAPPNSPPG